MKLKQKAESKVEEKEKEGKKKTLRKFLEKSGKFQGWCETAQALLTDVISIWFYS